MTRFKLNRRLACPNLPSISLTSLSAIMRVSVELVAIVNSLPPLNERT
ncbi:MAG: hypothetical protein IM516_04780 [Pseudanabaena sp. M158S2SP1A06QC]|jgi:hypothetical protein|nr:hypothetical protein [Pseudanabaena sp. M090S1SP2A07QC]MCA6533568.1 hypothetical protein [Pseudanabaena sp. M176S2SP2A07QC]MCA6539818.1 hypothetical protein [Pseudanabaena sp. M037S2SP2A07QC]MCA6550307.1 hypothetical protein [Pseudanabaena sp. M152S2SP2A07QC]MCA6553118.1 hypothetical protein [Pseudanabaena sp. M135S2SP2A07QC]MCA6566537.1 hypothetical protein [Pseudanabaena sp. M151S2SP2A07QC]MCA6567247.1 hypothetical protein [Pseudanabaena sp. M065S1SP2A07QC]MCA6576941.1 hypothetical prot